MKRGDMMAVSDVSPAVADATQAFPRARARSLSLQSSAEPQRDLNNLTHMSSRVNRLRNNPIHRMFENATYAFDLLKEDTSMCDWLARP